MVQFCLEVSELLCITNIVVFVNEQTIIEKTKEIASISNKEIEFIVEDKRKKLSKHTKKVISSFKSLCSWIVKSTIIMYTGSAILGVVIYKSAEIVYSLITGQKGQSDYSRSEERIVVVEKSVVTEVPREPINFYVVLQMALKLLGKKLFGDTKSE